MTGGSSEQHQLRSALIFPTTGGERHNPLFLDSIDATNTLTASTGCGWLKSGLGINKTHTISDAIIVILKLKESGAK